MVLFGVLVLFMVFCVVRFAIHQDIWLDESTQLSGMTLPPMEVIRWLAGEDQARFGVPGDRMPPVSYILDWMWSSAFPGSVTSVRLFHAALAVIGVVALVWAVARHMGSRAAIILLLLFVVSTRFVHTAVEIRAYPIFLGLTCVLLAIHVHIVGRSADMSGRIMAGYAAIGVLLVGTHFFGVVAYFALAAGLLWHFRSNPRSLKRIIWASVIVLLFAIMQTPFVLASKTLSPPTPMQIGLMDLVHYIARLLVGPVEVVWTAGAVAMFSGIGVLLLIAATALLPQREQSRSVHDALLASVVVALAIGVAVTMIAAFAVRGFDPLKMSYSTWTIPMLFFLIMGGWSRSLHFGWWQRVGRHAALTLVVGGSAAAAATQYARPELFIHGPHRFLLEQRSAAVGAPVLYDTEENWAFGYFPLRYSGKGAIAQWRLADSTGESVVPIVDGPPPPAVPLDSVIEVMDRLVLVVIQLESYAEIRSDLRGNGPEINAGPIGQRLSQRKDWQLEDIAEMPGYYSTRAWTWRRLSDQGR